MRADLWLTHDRDGWTEHDDETDARDAFEREVDHLRDSMSDGYDPDEVMGVRLVRAVIVASLAERITARAEDDSPEGERCRAEGWDHFAELDVVEHPVSPWRAGQAAWNAAHAAAPDLVEPLRGGDLDPFHHDDRVPAFVEEVTRRSVRARESTSAPWWAILDPHPHGRSDVETLARSITGPFRSREAAEEEMRDRPHRYSKRAAVWCLSGEVAARRERAASPAPAPTPPATVDPLTAYYRRQFEQERRVAALPADLDPGIRDAVIELTRKGFHTTDSGDGVTKPPERREIDAPHVAVKIEGDDAHEARTLVDFVKERWPEAEVDFTRHFCDDAPGQMFTLALVVWPEVSDV